jgi:Ca2+-binding RTX toxin-like protein
MRTHRSVRRPRTAALMGGLAALIVPLALAGSASANISSTFDAATGTLTVTSDAADGIAITCVGSQVKVNGSDPLASPLSCSAVVKLVVNGGPGDNTINLSGVTATDFTALTSSEAHGNGGNDAITGTDRADTLTGDAGHDRLVGFRGGDHMIGGEGDDTMVWNNGDGSDVMDGQDGNDTAEVNGAGAAGDVFTVNPNGQRVRFDRTNLVPFSIDIGTTEKLQLNAGGGDDTMTGAAGLANLIKTTMDGQDGLDNLTGTDGDDTLKGGPGNDRLVGFRGGDHMIGGDGDDTMVWNNGDGSDVMDGEAGIDTAEVNGAGTAGDDFTVNPNGQRVKFDRVNLVPFNIDIGTSEKLVVNGSGGDDRITGADGLAGLIASTFNGDDGKDIIVGTDGEDLLSGGKGFDIINAKDKAADQVECDGGIDFARVDRRDLVRGCELVLGGRLRVAVTAKVAKVERGVATLKLRCVATQGCKGTVKLLRSGKTLASKRFEMKRASTKTVRLKLDGRGRRLVAGASSKGVRVEVRIDARDAKGNGWRSTSQLRLTR